MALAPDNSVRERPIVRPRHRAALWTALAVSLIATATLAFAPIGLAQPTGQQTARACKLHPNRAKCRPATATIAAAHALPADWRTDMLASVNAQRMSKGAPDLRACARLDQVAQAYAAEMAAANHFDHTGPDGRSPFDRMEGAGYDYAYAAENIAAGQRSVREVMAGWIDSPGHYANIVNPHLGDVGFGYAYKAGSDYGTYWVQSFGSGGSC